MIGQPPRYSLEEPVFPFPALAAAAGRSALGGPREVTLACLMAARLVTGLIETNEISPEAQREWADRARQWSGTLAVPGEIRAMLMRVIELAGRSDRASAGAALDDLTAAAGMHLDEQSRAELKLVAQKSITAVESNNEHRVS